MKLNIEELAREARFKSRNGFIRVQHTNGSFVVIDEELEAFARLIVERCAAVCDKEQREWSEFSDGHVAFRETAAAIRNLLEAE